MLRALLILFLLQVTSYYGQTKKVQRRSVPPGQLLFVASYDSLLKSGKNCGYLRRRFYDIPSPVVSIPKRNVYTSKHVAQVELFDPRGQLRYQFDFHYGGQLTGGLIHTDHDIRWRRYLVNDQLVHAEYHYDDGGRLLMLDSTVTNVHSNEPADTAVRYTTVQHWVYLPGEVVNARNSYYNSMYLNKRLSPPPADAQVIAGNQKNGARVYLKKQLRSDYTTGLLYLDQISEEHKNFSATIYSDTGKREIYSLLPSRHYLVRKYHPSVKNNFVTQGADFAEPGWISDTAVCRKMPSDTLRSSYLCTLTRRWLMDSVFVIKPEGSKDSAVSLLYSIRYKYHWEANFSGDEYEEAPQLVLQEQAASSFMQQNWMNLFDRRFDVPNGHFVGLGDVSAFVKNRVKNIHIYYNGRDELQAMELDSSGKQVGGMDPHGVLRWRIYSDGAGHKYEVTGHYDYDGRQKSQDTAIYTNKVIRRGDTTITIEMMRRFTYKKGYILNERNQTYNEKYLNKRIRDDSGFGSFSAINPRDPKGPDEGYIYLDKPFKTNYDHERLYLVSTESGARNWRVRKDTTDISGSITQDSPIWKLIPREHTYKTIASGEDFQPPYIPEEHMGPKCGGSGSSSRGHSGGYESTTIFRTYEWTYNSKGLYDTCYKVNIQPDRYVDEDDEGQTTGKRSLNTQQQPPRYVLYTVRYEYY